MTDAILLTGSNGFLGTEIAAQLVRQTEKTIYALVRAGGGTAIKGRVERQRCSVFRNRQSGRAGSR